MNVQLLNGDCLDKLKELEDNSIDSIVTDPPYGLSFMGKKWDYDVPSTDIWEECMRVLKPGGHLLSFAGSRTYHRMAVRIEDAGFEIRDQIMWVYGSGFPKSHDVGKNVEKKIVGGKSNLKQVGTKKGLVATNHNDKSKTDKPSGFSYRTNNKGYSEVATDRTQVNGEIPVYEITNEWKGWGTALKPAHEPIVLARKPLIGTVADNVLEWGVGGINIDGCRIGTEKIVAHHAPAGTFTGGEYGRGSSKDYYENEGRFPANVIFDEEAGKVLDEQSGTIKGGKNMPPYQSPIDNDIRMNSSKQINRIGYEDTGGASRFFYCPKAQKKDRDEGVEYVGQQLKGRDEGQDAVSNPFKLRPAIGATYAGNQTTSKIGANPNKPTQPRSNIHPTVKPTELMKYLIRLVTPKGGVVLDPFMGSGSTGKAAVLEGMNFVGIEREEEYYHIAEQRIEHANKKTNHTKWFE